MKKYLMTSVAAAIASAILSTAAVQAQTPAAPVITASEDARLTAFLDAEFSEFLKTQPQVATRLGMKEGGDRWNDIGDKAAADMVKWRQASVARMKATFNRAFKKNTNYSPKEYLNAMETY